MKIKSIFLDTVQNLPREQPRSKGEKLINGQKQVVDFKKRLAAKKRAGK